MKIDLNAIMTICLCALLSLMVYLGVSNSIKKKPETKTYKENVHKVTVAINQNGELLLIDRTNGTYQVFSDTVGRAIHRLYSQQDQN